MRELKYIDDEQKYRDHGTGVASGVDIFDTVTGDSSYDVLLSDPDYTRNTVNLEAEIKMMSPEEYYNECASRIFQNSSSFSLKRQRSYDVKTLDELQDIVVNHKRKLFMPYLDYAKYRQEGLHRMMMAGDVFGWNTKFPVLVVHWYDYDRHEEEVEAQKKRVYKYEVSRAVEEAMEYQYPRDKFLEYFKDQIEFEIDKRYKLSNPEKFRAKDNLTVELNVETGDVSIITYQYETTENLSEFRITESEEDTSDDDTDIDINDLFFKP